MGTKEQLDAFVQELTELYSFRTFDDTNEMLMYNECDGLYHNALTLIEDVCVHKECANTPYGVKFVTLNLHGRTHIKRPINSGLVCVNNGILDIQNGTIKFLNHSDHYIFQSKLMINYNPELDCPVWKSTIKNMLHNEVDQKILQEWFGYHFMSGQPYEKAMFFVGKPSTGKSTSLYVLNELLGNCVSHSQLSDFTKDTTYAEANLYGKLGNTYSDMGQTVISDAGKFKVLTGSRDHLTARFPYEKPFSFINSAKLTFACNRLPPLSANVQGDMAFWKRILMIQFSNVVSSVDVDIYAKLQLELSGILNWALEGYIRLYNNKGIFSKNTDDIYATWTNSAYSGNPLDDFIDEYMSLYKDARCLYSEFRYLYDSWIKINDIKGLSAPELRACFAQKGVFESSILNNSTGKREIILKGICTV